MKFIRHLTLALVMFIIQSGTLTAATWTPPLDVSSLGVDAGSSQVSIDSAGNAIAVWLETDPDSFLLRVNSATAPFGGPWTEIGFISPDGENAWDPQIGVDTAGNAIAVWSRDNGSNSTIQYATKIFGGAWSGAADLTPTTEIAGSPNLSVNTAGHAVVAWEFSAATSIIRAATFDGLVWTLSPDLSDSSQDAFISDTTIDAAGNAVVVWMRSDGVNGRVQASYFNGTSWSVIATDLSAAGQDANQPQVSINTTGVAVAVWQRSDGSNTIVQARTAINGVWSGSIVDISQAGVDSISPNVAVDASGDAAILWVSDFNSIIATVLPFGGTSITPQSLSSGSVANNPSVGITLNGYAVATWEIFDTENRIQGSTLINGLWTTPVNIQSDATVNLRNGNVAVATNGRAVSIWSLSGEGNGFIQASFLDFIDPLGPVTNLRGDQRCNRFLTQTELFNVLRWNPSVVGSAVSYTIYRDAGLTQVIGIVLATNPLKFIDHNRTKYMTYTYYIVAVDSLNNVSTPVSVTVTPLSHFQCDCLACVNCGK